MLGVIGVHFRAQLQLALGDAVAAVGDVAEPAGLGGEDHVGLAHVGLAPRLVVLRLEQRGFLPVDRQLAQDLERGALAGIAADLLEVEAPDPGQLGRDAVARLVGAAVDRVFVLIFAELVEQLAWRLDAGVRPADGGDAAGELPCLPAPEQRERAVMSLAGSRRRRA